MVKDFNKSKFLFENKTSQAILKYIRENQDNKQGISKQDVAMHLDKIAISSRPTTLKMIEKLLDAEAILDDKKKDNSRSRLVIAPAFDLESIEFELRLLAFHIKDVHDQFKVLHETPASQEARDALVKDLLNTIENFKHRESIKRESQYKPKLTKLKA